MVDQTSPYSSIENLQPGTKSLQEVLEIVLQFENKGIELKRDKENGLDLCMKANGLGTIAIKASSFDRAVSLLNKGLEKYSATRE